MLQHILYCYFCTSQTVKVQCWLSIASHVSSYVCTLALYPRECCGRIRYVLHSLEGYITLIVQLSGIYGDVNKPCPRAVALRLGWFTAINP